MNYNLTSYVIPAFVIFCLLFVGSNILDEKKAFAQTGFNPQQFIITPVNPYTLNFYNVNSPATVMVGKNFTLTGQLAASSTNTLDHVYLSIQSTNSLLIYGQKTYDMGYFVNGVAQKNFQFKCKPLLPGPLLITLYAVGVQNNLPIVWGSTNYTLTAFTTQNSTLPASQLVFTNINVPPDITVGNSFQIQYQVVNKGSVVSNDVFVSPQVPNGLLVQGNSTTYTPFLIPSQSIGASLKLKAINAGSYPINLTVYSSNNPPSILPLTVTVGETSLRLSVTSTGTIPSYLYPGDLNDKITVGVTNYGQADVQGLVTKLILPKGITPYSTGADLYNLPLIPSAQFFPTTAQQFENFFINIDSNSTPGIYTIGMLNTDNNNNNYTMNFPIIVLPKADFQASSVSYADTDIFGNPEKIDSIYAGKTIVIRFEIKNTGTSRADNLAVQFQTTHDFTTMYGSSQSTGNVDTVGSINPGQTFTSDFYTTLSPTLEPGTYQGTLLITWQQGALPGNFVKSLTVPITVTPTPLVFKIPYLEMFLAGIGIAFITLYLLSRRKHKLETRTPI